MLTILITNIIMAERTGTETATFELALALYKRGHRVMVYSPSLGRLAMELSGRGVPVFDDISQIGVVPDIIHGNHNVALAPAMMRFRHTPALFVCHDVISPFDKPFITDRITHYLAVDYACQERLIVHGVPAQQTEILINAVDTMRYALKDKISSKPRKALAIVKAFHQEPMKTAYIQILNEACSARGITLDLVGRGVGKEISDISRIIPDYDICFAFSRSAIEACCTGAHVVITDEFGYGGVLSAEIARQWPENHLSRRILGPVNLHNLLSGIDAYSATDIQEAALVCRYLTNMDRLVARWEEIYQSSIQNYKIHKNDNGQEDRVLCQFISEFLPRATAEMRAVVVAKQMGYPQNNLQHIDIMNDSWTTEMPLSENTLTGALVLGEGWSHSESWGTWSCDDTALLNLPVKLLKNHGRVVQLLCKHYFPSSVPSQTKAKVTVYLGNRRLTTFYFSNRRPDTETGIKKKVELPAEALNSTNLYIRLRLVMEKASSPAFYGESMDTRRLGVGLMALKLSKPKIIVSESKNKIG